jgi:hypothetical protein
MCSGKIGTKEPKFRKVVILISLDYYTIPTTICFHPITQQYYYIQDHIV